MSKKDVKKSSKAKPKAKTAEDKKKKRKNRLFIFFTFLSSALLTGVLVVGVMHCLKSCNKNPEADERINVYVNQLKESTGWVLTVNGETNVAKVNKGDDLKAIIAPAQMAALKASVKPSVDGFEPEFYVRITDHAFPEKILGEIKLLKQEDETYVAEFTMRWDFEIDVSAFGKDSTEAYIYSLEKAGETITKTWRYDEKSLVTSDSPIIRDSDRGDHEEIPRNIFNEEIYIGSKVKWIEDSFLTHCTALNKQVHTETATELREIPGDFMMGCASYNQPLEFNDNLKIIGLGFMSNCSAFNQPLNFNQVEYLTGDTSYEVFMFQCTSFNSTINFGTKMKWIPTNFMYLCSSFNQPLTIPETVTNIGSNFMLNCTNMVSPITVNCSTDAFATDFGTFSVDGEHKETPAYQQGIPIYVKTAEDVTKLREKYPDLPIQSMTDWYRKLHIQVKPSKK